MTSQAGKRMGSAALVAAWLVVVLGFSSQPYQKQNLQPHLHRALSEGMAERLAPDVTFHYHSGLISGKSDPYGFIEFIIRKCAHLFEYGVLDALAYLMVASWIRGIYRRFGLTIVFTASIAFVDEWNQAHVGGRTSAIQDVGVDTFGAILAISLILCFRSAVVDRMGKSIIKRCRKDDKQDDAS